MRWSDRRRVLRSELLTTCRCHPQFCCVKDRVCCKTNQNSLRKCAISVSSHQIPGLLGIYCISKICSTRVKTNSLIRVCTSEPASQHPDRGGVLTKQVAWNESRYLLFGSTVSVTFSLRVVLHYSNLQGLNTEMSTSSAFALVLGMAAEQYSRLR